MNTSQVRDIIISLCFICMDPCFAATAAIETGTKIILTTVVPAAIKFAPIAYANIFGAAAGGAIAGGAATGGAAAATGGGAAAAAAGGASLLGPVVIGAVVGAVVIGGLVWLMSDSKKSKKRTTVPYRDASRNYVNYQVGNLSKSQMKKIEASGDSISITCFHVSCRSDHPKGNKNGWNAIGVVLYAYNGRTQWTMNGIRCRSGYIVLISSDIVKKHQKQETMHNTAFKMIFGRYPIALKHTLIAGGFSYQGRDECVFNSRSLNIGNKNTERVGFAQRDTVHFGTHVMNPLEQKYIAYVSSVPKSGDNIMCVHPDLIAKNKKRKAAK